MTAAWLVASGAVIGLATVLFAGAPVIQPWSFADAVATSPFASGAGVSPTRPPAGGSHDLATGIPTSITLTAPSGVSGARVRLSGEGFGARERVVIRFDADEVARATSDGRGRLVDVVVVVPTDLGAFAPAPFEISATGASSGRDADATFTLTG